MMRRVSVQLLLANLAILAGVSWLGFRLGKPSSQLIEPHGLISDGMVLQQGMPVAIWGTADPGQRVTVRFQNQQFITGAQDGHWKVWLHDLKPGGPYRMVIAGKNAIQLSNVLVGEVWVCGGQSNMVWRVGDSAEAKKTIDHSNYPNMRLFRVAQRAADHPEENVEGKWVACHPDTAANFPAVPFFSVATCSKPGPFRWG